MRVVRVVLGVLAIVLAVPLLGAGGVLLAAGAHRGPDGSFGAALAPLRADGYAVVVPDIDALLRADLPFARAGQTTVRLSVTDASGPTFIGLAPRAAVAGYLAGVAHTDITGIGVSTTRMPVTLSTVDGDQPPVTLPAQQSFWVATGRLGTLHWSAAEVRGRHLALVFMRADATPGLAISARAAVSPGWLVPTAWATIALGILGVATTVALLLGLLRRRDVVYLVAQGNPDGQPADPAVPVLVAAGLTASASPVPGSILSGSAVSGAASGGLEPPGHRPASPGRVWASASVRAQTLGEVLRAPTHFYALAKPGSLAAAVAVLDTPPAAQPVAPQLPPPVVTPVWLTADESVVGPEPLEPQPIHGTTTSHPDTELFDPEQPDPDQPDTDQSGTELPDSTPSDGVLMADGQGVGVELAVEQPDTELPDVAQPDVAQPDGVVVADGQGDGVELAAEQFIAARLEAEPENEFDAAPDGEPVAEQDSGPAAELADEQAIVAADPEPADEQPVVAEQAGPDAGQPTEVNPPAAPTDDPAAPDQTVPQQAEPPQPEQVEPEQAEAVQPEQAEPGQAEPTLAEPEQVEAELAEAEQAEPISQSEPDGAQAQPAAGVPGSKSVNWAPSGQKRRWGRVPSQPTVPPE